MCWLAQYSQPKPRSASTISARSESPLHLAVKRMDSVKGLYTLFILHPNICRSQRQHVHMQRKEYVLSEAPRSTTSMSHQCSVCFFLLKGNFLERNMKTKKKNHKTKTNKKPNNFKTGKIHLILSTFFP